MYASRGRGWHVQIAWNFTIGTILVLLVVSLLVLIEMLLSWLVLEMRLILAKNFHHVLDCVELLLHNSIEFLWLGVVGPHEVVDGGLLHC